VQTFTITLRTSWEDIIHSGSTNITAASFSSSLRMQLILNPVGTVKWHTDLVAWQHQLCKHIGTSHTHASHAHTHIHTPHHTHKQLPGFRLCDLPNMKGRTAANVDSHIVNAWILGHTSSHIHMQACTQARMHTRMHTHTHTSHIHTVHTCRYARQHMYEHTIHIVPIIHPITPVLLTANCSYTNTAPIRINYSKTQEQY